MITRRTKPKTPSVFVSSFAFLPRSPFCFLPLLVIEILHSCVHRVGSITKENIKMMRGSFKQSFFSSQHRILGSITQKSSRVFTLYPVPSAIIVSVAVWSSIIIIFIWNKLASIAQNIFCLCVYPCVRMPSWTTRVFLRMKTTENSFKFIWILQYLRAVFIGMSLCGDWKQVKCGL